MVPDEPRPYAPQRYYFGPNMDASDEEMEADVMA
jgi:hypothetical protein